MGCGRRFEPSSGCRKFDGKNGRNYDGPVVTKPNAAVDFHISGPVESPDEAS
ncbi:hypothetical protein PLANPX_1945 [Lacipirellula parvula]|uniref:Uncharacterized protein n=1 Tax=Lacipirellula parvula TaxID=2650471 RepID=A0A5K7XDD4_9BACT|nr:hypothetical protein PLANPX_1945 [Lacipirellula parvula]